MERTARRNILVVAALGQTVFGVIAYADDKAAEPQEQAVFEAVGLQRDLPPQKLIADSVIPPAGAATGHPAEVFFRESALGLIYVDAQGKSLYAPSALA